MIGPTVGEVDQAWISSGSAGDMCPGSPAAAISKRLGRKSWVFAKDGTWHEGNVTVTWV